MKRHWMGLGLLVGLALMLPAGAINENMDPAQGPVLEARAFGWLRDRADDAEIRSAIKLSIWDDPMLDNTDINVDVRNNRVVLRGVVNTTVQAERAMAIAKAQKGVVAVENQLIVARPKDVPQTFSQKVGEKIDSTDTSTRIRLNLAKAGLYEGNKIDIKTHNSVVVLEGRVNTWEQYHKVLDIVNHTDGVDKVINHLKVK